jgi:hypothetical protein
MKPSHSATLKSDSVSTGVHTQHTAQHNLHARRPEGPNRLAFPEPPVDAKKARRRYTNRESARRVRARKNAEWSTLQQQLNSLTRQNQDLSGRVAYLQGQKQNLLSQLIDIIAQHRALTQENAALQQELLAYQAVNTFDSAHASSSHLPRDKSSMLSLDGANDDLVCWMDVVRSTEASRTGPPTPFASISDNSKAAASSRLQTSLSYLARADCGDAMDTGLPCGPPDGATPQMYGQRQAAHSSCTSSRSSAWRNASSSAW